MLAHAVNHVAETLRLVQVRVAHFVIPLGALTKSLCYLVLLLVPVHSIKMSVQYSYSTITIQKIHIFGRNFNIFRGNIRFWRVVVYTEQPWLSAIEVLKT